MVGNYVLWRRGILGTTLYLTADNKQTKQLSNALLFKSRLDMINYLLYYLTDSERMKWSQRELLEQVK